MLYRIYTENKSRQTIEQLTNKYFQGYTLLQGTGHYQGKREPSIILEIVGNEIDRQIEQLARDIKHANNQESILVQKLQNEHSFI